MSQVLANRCPQQQQQQNQNSSAAGKQNAAAAAAFRHPVPELTVDYVRQSSCFDCEQRTNVTRPTTVESQQSDRQLEPASATPLAGLLRNPNSVVAQSTTMTTTTTHSVDIGCRPAEGGGGGDDDDGKTSRAAHSVGIQLTKSGVACSAGRPSRRHSSAEILELAACSDSSSALLLGTTSIRRSAAAAAAPGSDTWARGLSRQRSASTRVSRAQYGTASAATSSHQPQYYHQHQRQQRQAIQQQQQQHEGAAGAINWLSVPGVSNNNGSNRSSKQMSADAHLMEGGFEMMPMSSSWSSECAPRAASAAAGSFASQRPSGADARHKGAYCVRLTQSFRRPSATTTTAAAAAASGDSTNSGNNKESSAANDRSPSAAPSAVSASSASCAAAGHSDKASARNRAATKCLFSGADAPSSDAHHQPAVVLLQAAGVAAGPAPRLSSSSTSPMASQRDLDWPHHSASAGHYQHARSQSVRVTVSVSRAAGDQLVASRASSSHNKSSACINTSSNANSANSYAFGGSATNSNGAGIIRERDYRCAGAGYQQHQQHQQQQTAPSHSRGTSLPSSKNSSFRGSQAVSMCGSASTAASAAINEPHIVVSGGPSEPYYAGDDQEADYYLLRHFIVHGKNNKVVNRGDSFRRLHHHTQMQQQQQQQQPPPPPPPPHQQQQQPQQPQQYQQYQQPLQQQLQAQATAGASRHSSTSSVSTDNATGSPPPSPLARTLTQQHHHHASNQQQLQHQHQQQFQYYCHSDHQSTSSSRRASLLGPWSPGVADQQSSSGLTTSSATNFAPEGPEPFRVLMLGASGVGKTALTAQFMTSEYLNTYEASLDEDSYDRTVSVLLDGEESQLIFIDHPYGEISVENCMSTYNPNAYVVVYSVVDAESLRLAEEALHFLWRHSLIVNAAPTSPSSKTLTVVTSASGSGFAAATSGGSIEGSSTLSSTLANQSLTSTPPLLATTATVTPLLLPPAPPVVILVANKIDLVRSRLISPQAGKSLATSFDCKYIETSSGIQHNVDELLVGILKQIRLRIQMNEQLLSRASSSSSSARSLFRKKSGRRRQQQQRVNFQQQHKQTSDKGADDSEATANDGSCCIVTACSSPHANSGYLGYSPSSCSSTNRRSTSLRVRRMLGKAVWTCAEYYHRNKSRSCEDLHVL